MKMSFKQFFMSNWRSITSNNLFINRLVKFFKFILLSIFLLFLFNVNVFIIIRCSNSVLDSHAIGYAKKTTIDTLQLPPKPKKPIPPFFQFMQEKRSEVIEKHNLSVKGILGFYILLLSITYI